MVPFRGRLLETNSLGVNWTQRKGPIEGVRASRKETKK